MLSFRGSMTLDRSDISGKSDTRSSSHVSTPPKVQRFEDLPPWYQDNPFIRRGYRPVSHSAAACVDSLKYLHNETVNIYTHLVPAIGFLVAQNFFHKRISYEFPEATLADRAIFSCNLFAATITLLLSTSYHTFMNHSFPVSHFWLRIDYGGILALILGSFFSGIYVGFYCEPSLCRIYFTMISTLTVVTSTLVFHPRLQGLKFRSYRTTAFVLTGLSGFAPIIHGIVKYGWDRMWMHSGMPHWFLEGTIYGIGAFFFTTRIPESLCPGKYDIWGSSHQIFHVLVVIGSLVHLHGVWEAFKFNYTHNRPCPIP